MNWRFCPHCETQLDEETGICPACRWDPLDVQPRTEAQPSTSLIERYRGTEFDNVSAPAAMMARQADGLGRGRQALLLGIIGVAALYGGIVAWGVAQDSADRPARAGVTVHR